MGTRIIKTHNAQAIKGNRLGPFSRPVFTRNELSALDYTESSSTQVPLVFIAQTYYAGVPGCSGYVLIKGVRSPSLFSVETFHRGQMDPESPFSGFVFCCFLFFWKRVFMWTSPYWALQVLTFSKGHFRIRGHFMSRLSYFKSSTYKIQIKIKDVSE